MKARNAIRAVRQANVSHYAAALAFNAFIAVLPVMFGLLVLLDVLTRHGLAAETRSVLVQVFPADVRPVFGGARDTAEGNGVPCILLSLVTMAWSGSALFASLEFAFASIEQLPLRRAVHQRFAGLRLVPIFCGAILLAVAVNLGASLVPLGHAVALALTLVGAVLNRELGYGLA